MTKNRFAIDNVIYSVDSGQISLNIQGWCLIDGRDTYDLSFYADEHEIHKVTVTRVFRQDVARALEPKYSVTETKGIGFVLSVKFGQELLEKEVVLKAKQEDTELVLYRCIKEELTEIGKKWSVSYAFDKMIKDEDTIMLEGWAVSLSGDQLEYELEDEKGNRIECKVKRTARPDINRMFYGESYKCMAGFLLEFQDTGCSDICIKMKSCGQAKTVVVSRKSIIKATKKSQRKYQSVKEIMKGTTWKDISADIGILFKKGPVAVKEGWKDRYSSGNHQYDRWFRKHAPGKEELLKQRYKKFAYMPKISIIVPAYHTPASFLREMVASVQAQSYENWELCIADGGTNDNTVEKIIGRMMSSDPRIHYKKLEKNEGISGNTNQAIQLATGDFLALLDHDDVLTPDALYEVVSAINDNPEAKVFYSDEDKVSGDLKTFYSPHFKSDFNRDLLRSNNYICHLFVVSCEIVGQVGLFDPGFDGSQDYDFILRCTEVAKQVVHIPKILYHWRVHNESTAANSENKMYCFEAGQKAIEAHLKRCGIRGQVSFLPDYLGYYQVKYEQEGNPLVSIIIPNKDEKESLELCVNSILDKTTYSNYEIIIVENNSTTEDIWEYYHQLEKHDSIKVIRWESGFNYSAINNFGVSQSKGEYLLFLNNDTEILDGDWLETMLADCQRENIGIVGVKLCYPDMTLQHCGVMLGLGGVAGHIFNGYPEDYMGCFGRAQLQQDVNAVTAACMMVRRSAFEEAAGFEEELAVAFNDVDFCLKIRKMGFDIMYEPMVCLKHYESKSRGKEDTVEKQLRFQKEVDYMNQKWGNFLQKGDSCYSENLLLVEKS